MKAEEMQPTWDDLERCGERSGGRRRSVGLGALKRLVTKRNRSPDAVDAVIEDPNGEEAAAILDMFSSGAFTATAVISHAAADIGMAMAESAAESSGWDVTICISDACGIPIQVKRSTFPASYEVAVGKAKTAALFRTETGKFSDELLPYQHAHPFMMCYGGVPIMIDGSCCGAVGVAGLTPSEDHLIAKAAVKAITDIYWSYKVLATERTPGL